VKSKHVRKIVQHDPGVNIVEHTYVKSEEEVKSKPEPPAKEEK